MNKETLNEYKLKFQFMLEKSGYFGLKSHELQTY